VRRSPSTPAIRTKRQRTFAPSSARRRIARPLRSGTATSWSSCTGDSPGRRSTTPSTTGAISGTTSPSTYSSTTDPPSTGTGWGCPARRHSAPDRQCTSCSSKGVRTGFPTDDLRLKRLFGREREPSAVGRTRISFLRVSVHLKEIRGTQRIVCINQRLELLGLAKWCSRRRVATGWLDC